MQAVYNFYSHIGVFPEVSMISATWCELDVICNKSWLAICHGVHVQYLVEPLSISSTHRRSVLVLQMSLILNKEMTVFNLQKVY